MAPKIIVSYDGTDADHDALAYGRVLADAGAEVSLAYVRHTSRSERRREELEHDDAERLLERGAQLLGIPGVQRHVVLSASTGEGLGKLADQVGADAVIFGSEYRTATGHVQPGNSVQRLLAGGPVAIGIAPAGLRHEAASRITTVGLVAEAGDEAAQATAATLAASGDAGVTTATDDVDLLVIGSRPEAPQGHVMISSSAQRKLDEASSPVLVVPRGRPVRFGEGSRSAPAPDPAPITA
jgi:nucleotide-binding universal stress UspA family protein